MRPPQRRSQDEPREARGLGKHDIPGDEHQHPGHEDRTRAHAVAERTGGIGERDIGKVEDRERQRRHGFAEPDIDSFQDQEGFGEAREREQEADLEQALGVFVELAETGEEG